MIWLKSFLTIFLAVVWILHQFGMDKEMMLVISGAKDKELSYWGTKAAGFALIAATTLFVSLIPVKQPWCDTGLVIVGALGATFSGYYWLQDSTSGHAGDYIWVLIAIGIIMTVCIIAGPGVTAFLNSRGGGSGGATGGGGTPRTP